MCGCPEGTDALEAVFHDFLRTQQLDGRQIEVSLWTKDRRLWAPPFIVNPEGPTWNGKLSFLAQLPDVNEELLDPGLTKWSYEWVVAMWDALFSITFTWEALPT